MADDDRFRRPWLVPGRWRTRRGDSGTGRRLATAAATGLLVLMTLWGVGRSGFPSHEDWFLGAGVVAGASVVAVGTGGALRRRRDDATQPGPDGEEPGP